MRLRPLIVALAFAAAGLATTAQARTFYVIQSGGDAWTVMDPDGIERSPGSAIRKAWDVRVQRNILSGAPPQPGYVRTLSEYDCDAGRTRWREFNAYSRSGSLLISKVNPNPEWGPATDASDTYAAFSVICQGGGGGAVVSADSVAKVVIGLMGSWDPPATPVAALPAAKSVRPVAKGPVAKPPLKARATAKPKT